MVHALIMTNELHRYTYMTYQHTQKNMTYMASEKKLTILKNTDTYSYSKNIITGTGSQLDTLCVNNTVHTNYDSKSCIV